MVRSTSTLHLFFSNPLLPLVPLLLLVVVHLQATIQSQGVRIYLHLENIILEQHSGYAARGQILSPVYFVYLG